MASNTAARRIFHSQRGVVQTSGNSTTTLDSYTLLANSSVSVEVTINARNAQTALTNKAAMFKYVAAAGRAAGSTVLISPSPVAVFPDIIDATLAGIAFTIDVDTNDIRLRATGLVGFDIHWTYEWRILVN